MRTVSTAWRPLVEAYRQGLGVEEWLAVLMPSRNLVLTGRPWPDGWLPATMQVYPHLGPMGQGLGAISVELADDRSSRLGTVACEVRVQAGQIGTPLSDLQQLLLTLGEQPALVWAAFRGGALQEHHEILQVFSGRVATPKLTRGVLSLTIVDGVAQDHRDIEVPLGTSVFPGAPLDAHGLPIPLVLGTALGIAPTLVSSAANGTLATPLPAAAVETIDLTETGANFLAAGAIVVGGETITYTGRRVGLLLNGMAALQLLSPVRSVPLAHLAGETVTLAPPIIYRYLLGLGLTPLELLAVRDQDGALTAYTFVPDQPGLPTGTAVLELPTAHEGVNVDVQVLPAPPLPLLLNGGFEAGELAPWTPLPGTTAAIVLQEVQAGFYKLQLQDVGPTLVGVTQDVAVEVGERYVLLFNWRTPVQMRENLLTNGDFRFPAEQDWEITVEGMEYAEPLYIPPPLPAVEPPEPPPEPPRPSEEPEHGQEQFTLPDKPLYDVTPPVPGEPLIPPPFPPPPPTVITSFHISMRQSLVLPEGQEVQLDVRVENCPRTVGPQQPCRTLSLEARLWPDTPGAAYNPSFTTRLQPSNSFMESGLVEYQIAPVQGIYRPLGTNYRFEISISGTYVGTMEPIRINTATVVTTGR